MLVQFNIVAIPMMETGLVGAHNLIQYVYKLIYTLLVLYKSLEVMYFNSPNVNNYKHTYICT